MVVLTVSVLSVVDVLAFRVMEDVIPHGKTGEVRKPHLWDRNGV
jgi:hypothetical protein